MKYKLTINGIEVKSYWELLSLMERKEVLELEKNIINMKENSFFKDSK